MKHLSIFCCFAFLMVNMLLPTEGAHQGLKGTVIFDGFTGKDGYGFVANKTRKFPAFFYHSESGVSFGLKAQMVTLPLRTLQGIKDFPQWSWALGYMKCNTEYQKQYHDLGQPAPQFDVAAQEKPILDKYRQEIQYVIARANYATSEQKTLVNTLREKNYAIVVASDHDTQSVHNALHVEHSPFANIDTIIAVCDEELLQKHNIDPALYQTVTHNRMIVAPKKRSAVEYINILNEFKGPLYYVSKDIDQLDRVKNILGDRVTLVYCKDPQDTADVVAQLKAAGVRLT